jgi:hypothetical protein
MMKPSRRRTAVAAIVRAGAAFILALAFDVVTRLADTTVAAQKGSEAEPAGAAAHVVQHFLVSQQSEKVTIEQSRNVPLTGSGWMGAGRTATDEPSRERPAGDVEEGEEATHHASRGGKGTGRQRAAGQAIAEGAEETR